MSERLSAVRATLQEAFDECTKLADEIERFAYHGRTGPEPDEEEEFAEDQFRDALERLALHLLAACEMLDLTSVAARLETALSKEKSPTELNMAPWVGELYSPALHLRRQYYRVLAPHLGTGGGVVADEARLRSILRATGNIIYDRGLEPENEADVRNAIRHVLRYVFPDVVREIPISKPVKTYRADIGVRGLRTAIEYKFVTSESEFKACLGGIYEDTSGYAGSTDWTRFIAVLYTTDAFFTQEQIEEELRLASLPENWEVMVVQGRGRRPKRAAATQSVGPPTSKSKRGRDPKP